MPSKAYEQHKRWAQSLKGKAWISAYRKSKKYRDKENTLRRQNYASNKDVFKDRNLRKLYGISLEDKLNMYSIQQGNCAICQLSFAENDLFVDHNHTTNKVRGLLCCRCNFAIGYVKEDPFILKQAIKYLETTNE